MINVVSDANEDENSQKSIKVDTVVKEIMLFLVMLPNDGVFHGIPQVRFVKIISKNFAECNEFDFLAMCAKEIFKTETKLNYIYNTKGKMITSLKHIKNKAIIFVKRGPGFNLTEREINVITRMLERNQRERRKYVDIKDIDPLVLDKYQTLSNYSKLITKRILKEMIPETFTLKQSN